MKRLAILIGLLILMLPLKANAQQWGPQAFVGVNSCHFYWSGNDSLEWNVTADWYSHPEYVWGTHVNIYAQYWDYQGQYLGEIEGVNIFESGARVSGPVSDQHFSFLFGGYGWTRANALSGWARAAYWYEWVAEIDDSSVDYEHYPALSLYTYTSQGGSFSK